MYMNAAHRSVLPRQPRSSVPAINSRVKPSKPVTSSKVTNLQPKIGVQKVERLNVSQRPKPLWLVSLLFLQRSSDLITFLLVAATLTIYSWTVYTQQQWSREYDKLEHLQREERQLTTANAVIKDQLAQQAEQPGTGLITPSQANTIYLPAVPQRPSHPVPNQQTAPETDANTPLGY
jgi:hypothetical protein